MREADRDDEDRDDPAAPSPPSKSQRKREATALRELGERVVTLTPTQLSRVPLPDELRAAVRVAQGIAQRGGRKRQLQYIGKLMRRLDEAETAAIRAALATLLPGGRL
jgi:ribosome-associated protein